MSKAKQQSKNNNTWADHIHKKKKNMFNSDQGVEVPSLFAVLLFLIYAEKLY